MQIRSTLALLICSLLIGCGAAKKPEFLTVVGKVDLNGEPVQFGSISFIPEGGLAGPSGGAEVVNGAYTVAKSQGLVPGNYRVEVVVIPVKPGDEGGNRPVPTSMGAPVDPWYKKNPTRFFRDKSQVVDLKLGDNSFDLPLASSKK
ncbi:hypothetical protein SH668x_002206 [Planctomicrobium sp. SH668]|uniref:hypothetical protein n=1 Tax=Planctomicrobium sp. SH668 TaxID=3448126 RepID=UPI003F5C6F3B